MNVIKRPDKLPDPLSVIRRAEAAGKLTYVRHARERLNQREVTTYEVREVLRTGWNEKRKDEFKPEFGGWNYAVRGKTIDDRELRIAVAIDVYGAIVVTVVDLDK